MENQQQQPQNTPLCRANCGFYGSPATEDLCSKCFKDMIQRKQETGASTAQRHSPATTTGNVDGATGASTSVPAVELTGTAANENFGSRGQTLDQAKLEVQESAELKSTSANCSETETASEPNITDLMGEAPKKGKNRCQVCNKRVGLTGFQCRCGGLYCGEHRYDNAHNCTFDYKTTGREELRKSNPQVISEKIQRI